MCERCNLPTAPLRASLHSAPNRSAPQETDSLAVNRNRHNPTESNEPQRKLVRAREATAFRFLSPNMDRIRRIPWSCRPRTLTPIDRTEPANRLCLTLHSAGFTMEGAAWHSPSGQYW